MKDDPPPSPPDAFLILGAGTPWVNALGAALAENGHFVHAVAPYDWLNYRRLRPTWPAGRPPRRLRRDFWVLPPGYVGRLERWFRPFLRMRLRLAWADLARRSGRRAPWLVVPYPWFVEIARAVPGERLIYYHLDDYTLYQPARRATIQRQGDALRARAAFTLCLSRQQTETLRARDPANADYIRHFPLGVEAAFLNRRPETPPRANQVGFAGSLLDRVDWRLVGEVATGLPEADFVFAGSLTEGFSGGGQRPDWQAERAAALALPNVRLAGWLPPEQVHELYWSSAVSWIPYAAGHAFNLAACPTKIMDALAAGRLVVSTDLPECRLYPEWIALVHSAAEMTAWLRGGLSAPFDPQAARRQVEFARGHTWDARARELAGWLRGTGPA